MLPLILFIFYFIVTGINGVDQKPCQLREYKRNEFVCVCNETYCDSLNVEQPKNFGEYVLISSTESGQRFYVHAEDKSSVNIPRGPSVISIRTTRESYHGRTFVRVPNGKTHTVDLTIDLNRKYQKIVGFGGAFTGTVSFLLDRMSKKLRQQLYTSYYSKTNGIGYTMMRMPIGGCDFDLEPWAYNEKPENDLNLSSFRRLDDRDLHRIGQLNELKETTHNDDIKLIGAAWSPPPWMKSNNKWSGASRLKNEYYATWADYHLRYLELMSEQNVTFWGISTGNEPLNGVIGWVFVHFMSLGS